METHHETKFKNHATTLSETEKSNVKSHIDSAGDDHTHASAKTIILWVGGIIGAPAVAGYSWKKIKDLVSKHI